MSDPLAPTGPAPAKKSDLGVRTASAIVMVAIAGTALWAGGWVFLAFVVAVGLGVLWEWWNLAQRIAATPLGAALWLAGGASYVGIAMAVLVNLRQQGLFSALVPIILVIAVDVGAYFAGRTFGGPKIAPAISPSKTWSGLLGGMTAAAAVMFGVQHFGGTSLSYSLLWCAVAALLAVFAQAGDFFESWMKRRAGVKDSGHLIPGHGGLFDRVDGLLAVLLLTGLILAFGVIE